MIKRTLNIPVYDCKVVVYLAEDINPISVKLCKKHNIERREEAISYAEVLTTESVHLYYILFSTEFLSLKLLVHEVTHLGGRILRDRGHDSHEEDEPLAYLNGFITEELEKIIRKNNLHFKTKIKSKSNVPVPIPISTDNAGKLPEASNQKV